MHISEIINQQEPAKSEQTSPELYSLDQVLEVCQRLEPGFLLRPDQEKFYTDLFNYFAGRHGSLDTEKGLLICGPVGTGKSFSMRLFQKIFPVFGMVVTRHIIRDYFSSKTPGTVIDKYGRESFYKTATGIIDKKKPQTWCFDDFGLEAVSVKNYGNEANILEEIMLDRYDLALSCGMKTFITTNLTVDMIEQNYGPRVRDRFRETMNLIVLNGETFRK